MRQALILFALFAAILASGCVSKGQFEQQVAETEQLASDLTALQERNDMLSARNEALNQDLTEALSRINSLQQDLARARADIERLEKILSTRSAEAGAAMAEMRQTIDRLEDENRQLAAQVEQERIAREARIAQMKATYNELVDKMEAEIERGEITISELKGKLTVNMVEKILFDSGQADIKPAGLKVLKRVGDILKDVEDKEIRVEGHSDNIPISARLQEKFPSNWELSTARATNVVHFLQDEIKIPGELLSACGYSQYAPVADNDSPKGRALNRRIQIVLVPR